MSDAASSTRPADIASVASIAQLKTWVRDQYQSKFSQVFDDETLASCWQPLKGDAGFRQYFRVCAEPRLIAVYAPVETENSQAFVAIAQYLRQYNVHTPEMIAVDLARGFLLLEDLGETTYFDHLNETSANELYGRALQALIHIQSAQAKPALFSDYDTNKLRAEMALFTEWFVPQLIGHTLTVEEQSLIDTSFNSILNEVIQLPQVVVHRDYHSQNLMYRGQELPGIVDFQDAVMGPITYDLVSILRDCYIRWPDDQVDAWARQYFNMLLSRDMIPSTMTEADFMRGFDWMGIQRHIKVLGIFARLWLRDGKAKYLTDLPLVIHYFTSVAARYHELTPLVNWFQTVLMPVIEAQPWMKSVTAKV